MSRRLVLLAALLLLQAPARAQDFESVPPGEVGLSGERLERLTAALGAYVESERLPGAVILVLRDGLVAYEETFGYLDREAGAAMPSDAIFRIASQTKALVSVGIMMLQEEGRLLIGDRVGAYLPEFSETSVAVPRGAGGYDVVPAARPMTIRDLLTHTAGVGYGYGPAADQWEAAGIQGWYFANRKVPIRETVRRMASLPMDAHPGSAYVYGYGTDILGAVIEVVSGMPLDRFLEDRITGPLGMRDTHFYLPEEKAERLAVVYSATGSGLVRAPDAGTMQSQGEYVDGPRMSFSGGAGLLSTARDYARFLQMLLNGGELDGVRILSRTSVALMIVDHLGDIPWAAGNGFGLGFRIITDSGRFGQPGSVGAYEGGGAYHSKYWVDPGEGLVVVYFTQLVPAGGVDDHAKVWALVYQAIVD